MEQQCQNCGYWEKVTSKGFCHGTGTCMWMPINSIPFWMNENKNGWKLFEDAGAKCKAWKKKKEAL